MNSNPIRIKIDKELNALKEHGLLRSLPVVRGAQGTHVSIDGKDALLLCSNDYLSLASHPEVKEAAMRATEKYGTGAGASRLVSGTMELHLELEERIARFKGTEAALVFNSGYSANTALIPALASRESEIFSDRLNHASILDGIILSRANFSRYPNRDTSALERLLKESKAEEKLIVTDGVFSMDGVVAPLKEIKELATMYNALLIVDDAHGTGALGENGRGTFEHLGIDHTGTIQMGTFGKALGSFGAFVAGDSSLIRYLTNKARPFIYTTALPPAVCAATIKALDIIESDNVRVKRLQRNAEFMRGKLTELGVDILGSTTQIIPVLVGQAKLATKASTRLLEDGIFVQAIRPPTVPKGCSRLRVTVTSEHTEAELARAALQIAEVVRG